MKYIIELNHPKHYYQFKYVMKLLIDKRHEILVLARDKDVLLKLLQEEQVSYQLFGEHKKNIVGKIFNTFSVILQYSRIVRKFKPDIIVSKASFYGAFIAKLFRKKTVIFPDSEVVFVTNKFVVPLVNLVITPETFELDYGKKHTKISGLFENCYLHPSVFTPNEAVLAQYDIKKPYAIFRFIGWNANHDIGNKGFTLAQKTQLVDAVEDKMNVYISSEKELPENLKIYKLQTPASEIHRVLHYADLYMGDSQTMATEAAILGTPAIRSNSFVGPNDMSNFKLLENKYGLLKNLSSFEEVLNVITDFSANSRKKEWEKKREEYLNTVGDSNQIIANILENIK